MKVGAAVAFVLAGCCASEGVAHIVPITMIETPLGAGTHVTKAVCLEDGYYRCKGLAEEERS